MGLLKLYESASAVSIPNPVLGEDLVSGTNSWYMRRYDCVVAWNSGYGSCFKVFRDGTVVRMCRGGRFTTLYMGYDSNVDKAFSYGTGLAAPVYNDAIGMLYNPQDPAAITNSGLISPDAHFNMVVYGQKYYPSPVGGSTVTSNNLTNGDVIDTLSLTGSISPFSLDRVDITDDGWLVGMDFDNGSFGVLRFRHLTTGEQYTSTVDRAKFIWLDRVNKNLWVYRLSDSKMVTYSLQVAPATVSAVTMGSNRSRYREDALSVTVTGSNGEPAAAWPVEWVMSGSVQGHLEFDITETDENGLAENRWCGPGVDDYLGGSLTITARTAY